MSNLSFLVVLIICSQEELKVRFRFESLQLVFLQKIFHVRQVRLQRNTFLDEFL